MDVKCAFVGKIQDLNCTLQDLCFSSRNGENGEEIRVVYCLHAVNHVLKYVSVLVVVDQSMPSNMWMVVSQESTGGVLVDVTST